jgi:hypothetical protein
LYNLKADQAEQKDLAASMPEKVQSLEKKLMRQLEEQNAFIPEMNPDFDQEAFAAYRKKMTAKRGK